MMRVNLFLLQILRILENLVNGGSIVQREKIQSLFVNMNMILNNDYINCMNE